MKNLRGMAAHQAKKLRRRRIRWSIEAALLLLSCIWAYESLAIVPKHNAEAKEMQEKLQELPMEDWVLEEVKKAGLNPYEAYLIIQCESGWRDDIAVIEPNGTISFGLWQINSIHNQRISNSEKLDYKAATRFVIEKRLHDGNWSAWTCAKKMGL